MTDYTLRSFRPGDEAGLLALWQTAFPETVEEVRAFFDRFLNDRGCILAEAEGRIVSAMYILPGPDLWPHRKRRLTSAYTYALATLPEYRGRGIGSAVYKACCEAIWDRGIQAACVWPAEERLYPFYEKASGARPLSAAREARYTREELKAARRGMCARIDVMEYAGLREMLLGGEPHASMPEDFCRWQEERCESSGGGLFVAGGGVAAVEMDGDTCHIKELLEPMGDETEAAAAVAAFCPAKEYIVRAPAVWEGPGRTRPLVLAAFREKPDFPLPDDLWWGFGFD